jgi:hypothetical protein
MQRWLLTVGESRPAGVDGLAIFAGKLVSARKRFQSNGLAACINQPPAV